MSKHTPGPWLSEGNTVYALTHFGWRKGVEQFKNRFSASVCKDVEASEEERAANTRLITAAPELLEALVMVRDADEDCKRDGLPTIPPLARSKIDAAIAKAEGGAA